MVNRKTERGIPLYDLRQILDWKEKRRARNRRRRMKRRAMKKQAKALVKQVEAVAQLTTQKNPADLLAEKMKGMKLD